jgi:hypothetical protein
LKRVNDFPPSSLLNPQKPIKGGRGEKREKNNWLEQILRMEENRLKRGRPDSEPEGQCGAEKRNT